MLGKRNYELGNHHGNVLAVISDKVGMKQDSVWATVVNITGHQYHGNHRRFWTPYLQPSKRPRVKFVEQTIR